MIQLDNLKYKNKISIALGNFDGVHNGHVSLIKSMIKDSKELGLKSSILLFGNHTKSIIIGETPNLLTNNFQREKIIGELGVDILYKMDFNLHLRGLTPEDFIKDILIDQLNVKAVTVGYDYRFGYKAQGNTKDLQELGYKYGFKVTILDPVTVDDEVVSSTKIRNYIEMGNIKKANNMLGRIYTLSGKVIPGKNLGHKLGFPTANIELYDKLLVPKSGVYSTRTSVMGKTYLSVTSIGMNPTFSEKKLKIESHIIDFHRDIYGEEIGIEIIDYIREEKRFNSLHDLKAQIKIDVNRVKSEQ